MLNMCSRFALFTILTCAANVLGRPLSYRRADVLEARGCATIITARDRAETEHGLHQGRLEPREAINATGLRPATFDLYWHVVYANETYEGGYVPDSQIMEQIEVMKKDFNSTNISWNFKNITRINNPDWFENAYPGSPQEQAMKREFKHGDNTALNVFTAGFNSTNKSLGYASLPSAYYREPMSDGLIIRYTTLPGGSHENYNHGRTTVHEIGHWLGLYHTFEGGCTGVGDNVADTAPESSGAIGCPVGRKSCPDSKELDPIQNFMDYSFDTCMTHFTPGQAVRMHEAIWAFRTRRPPVANSTVPSVTPSPSPSSTTITSTSASVTPSGTGSSASTASGDGDDPEAAGDSGDEGEGAE